MPASLIAAACLIEPAVSQQPVVVFEVLPAREYFEGSPPPPVLEELPAGIEIRGQLKTMACLEHGVEHDIAADTLLLTIVSAYNAGPRQWEDCRAFVTSEDFALRVTGLPAGIREIRLSWAQPMLAGWSLPHR